MRGVVVTSIALVAALAATPALANSFVRPTNQIIRLVPNEAQQTAVPSVARGQQFAIHCGCLKARAAEDIRVVLALSNKPGERATGYEKLLATDQVIVHGAVRVRVPDAPDLANHTVQVQVYVLNAKGSHSCNAGRFRVV